MLAVRPDLDESMCAGRGKLREWLRALIQKVYRARHVTAEEAA